MKTLQVGQTATSTRIFTVGDLAEYALLAGIEHPLNRVPGPLLGGMFSCLLGTKLPGRGTNYLKQHLEFHRPAVAGEELFATVEIVRLRPEKHLVNLKTTCVNTEGYAICVGEALVFVKDLE